MSSRRKWYAPEEQTPGDGLEAYLDAIADGLALLPAAEREQQMRELRQHLERMAEAKAGDHLTPEEVTEAVLLQFGDAGRVARELRRASWHRAVRRIPYWPDLVLNAIAASGAARVACLVAVDPIVRRLIPPSDSQMELWRLFHVPTARYFWPVLFLNDRMLPVLAVGLLALLLVWYKDGWYRIVRRWTSAGDAAGAAAQWLFACQIANSLVLAVLYHVMHYRFTFAGSHANIDSMEPSFGLLSVLAVGVPVLAASLWAMRRCSNLATVAGGVVGAGIGSVEAQIPPILFAVRFEYWTTLDRPLCAIVASICTTAAVAVSLWWFWSGRRAARA